MVTKNKKKVIIDTYKEATSGLLMKSKRIRTAIYIRVSTEEQVKEGFSIDAQKNRLLAFIKSQEWELYDIYVDEGISAKSGSMPERKELLRMIDDIKQQKIDVVLVIRLDRLTRSVLDLYKLLEIFEEHKCAFRSATEVFDTTTPTGKLFITIVAAMAQWERETIAERVKEGMEQMVREGKWHGGPLPFGFDKELKVIDTEAQQVILIFDKYNSGEYGEDNLAVWLNENGYTRKGEPWKASALNYILQNPIYIGHLRWNTRSEEKEIIIVENVVPAILQISDYEYAQSLRANRRGIHPKSATSRYIFSGRVKCKRCGAPLKGQGVGKYFYYACTNRRHRTCSQTKLIKESLVEMLFLEKINATYNEYADSTIRKVASEIKDTPRKDNNELEIKRLEKELTKIKTRRSNWIKALGDGDITQSEYREHTSNDRENEERFLLQLEELQGKAQPNLIKTRSTEQLTAILKDLYSSWSAASKIEKKNLVHIATKSIHVDLLTTGDIEMDIIYS